MLTLADYLYRFTHLKQGVTRYGKAPHKPVLLITLLELIGRGHITDNQVLVNTELVGTFQENWRLLVNTLHQADFTQPFYYLQSEQADRQPLWQLHAKPGSQINAHIKSVNTLINVLAYGSFAPPLFALLLDAVNRQVLLNALLQTYFAPLRTAYLQAKATGQGYLTELEHYVLNEPEVKYQTLAPPVTEEDIFVRGGLFKKLIPRVYNHTCCITGLRIESTFGHTLIDACHIEPFSLNGNDQITNGLALCPNLHRAFDRGLISIDQQYRVITSPHLREDHAHPYSLGQLHGRPLRLPDHRHHRPALANLEWHRGNVFRG